MTIPSDAEVRRERLKMVLELILTQIRRTDDLTDPENPASVQAAKQVREFLWNEYFRTEQEQEDTQPCPR